MLRVITSLADNIDIETTDLNLAPGSSMAGGQKFCCPGGAWVVSPS